MKYLDFEVKRATILDYEFLFDFYNEIYPKEHPLKNIDFWDWQYGNKINGSAYIVLSENKIFGQVGAYFNDNIAWIINVYLKEETRGMGFLNQMYEMARDDYGLLAATSANTAGLGLYRNMGWIRYANLERMILLNPKVRDNELKSIFSNVDSFPLKKPNGNHYWSQPGLFCHTLSDGSTGIVQAELGGFRFVEIVNPNLATEELWSLGLKWCDYVSSWNDKKLTSLSKQGWYKQMEINFPWYLNPLDFSKKFEVTFLSEQPLSSDYICKRYNSDHGRVGSLPNRKSL